MKQVLADNERIESWLLDTFFLQLLILKGTLNPKSKIHIYIHTYIYPFNCSAIYPSRMFRCELPGFRDIGHLGPFYSRKGSHFYG